MNVATGYLTGVPADQAMPPPVVAGERLNGWKCIAAHFGRDRTTVIRWARERGLPVYRMPGGRTGTIYALRHELDQWAGSGDVSRERPLAPKPEPEVLMAAPSRQTHAPHLGVLVLLVMLSVAATVYIIRVRPPAHAVAVMALSSDPVTASRFLTARDLIAERRADGLERAIALLEGVTRSDPGFAPGHAALGEALLLSREFGKMPDGEAFARARHAARAAIRINPDLIAGRRLLGFIAYWADHDFVEASVQFRHALATDAQDAMTHFWYGNILSDHGDHDAALQSLGRARLLLPGSVAIQTDLAWAQWAAGEDAAAIVALHDIVRRHPDFAVAHDCLSLIALLNGDDRAYVHHFGALARLRAQPLLIERSRSIDAVLQSKGPLAMHRLLLRHAMEDIEGRGGSRVWAATIASVMQDRDRTLHILAEAERRQEQWGEAGLLRRIAARWPKDLQISVLLDKLHSRSMV